MLLGPKVQQEQRVRRGHREIPEQWVLQEHPARKALRGRMGRKEHPAAMERMAPTGWMVEPC